MASATAAKYTDVLPAIRLFVFEFIFQSPSRILVLSDRVILFTDGVRRPRKNGVQPAHASGPCAAGGRRPAMLCRPRLPSMRFGSAVSAKAGTVLFRAHGVVLFATVLSERLATSVGVVPVCCTPPFPPNPRVIALCPPLSDASRRWGRSIPFG